MRIATPYGLTALARPAGAAAGRRSRLRSGLPRPDARRVHTPGTPAAPPLDIAALRAALAARPAQATYDVLSPMPSHLLNVSLSDYLPAEARADAGAQTAASEPDKDGAAAFRLPASPTVLPHGHHLVHFPLQKPPSLLQSDGTDPHQSPGPPFERRMWAGGAVRFVRPADLVLDGRRAVCVERLGHIGVKGPPGAEKVFVDVWRRYGPAAGADAADEAAIDADPAIEERRTLVFIRDAPRPLTPAEPRIVTLPFSPDFAFTLTPTATLLFHFSALTFNAHAIHLDPHYCSTVEGHRNLLFHGPLSLVLMLSILRSQLADPAAIQSIEYRNLAPLYADELLRVCIRRNPNQSSAPSPVKWDIWIEGPSGSLCVRASAVTS